MAKIKKKDQVMVIAGKDKGKCGEVLKVLYAAQVGGKPKIPYKVIVRGLNLSVKHQKPDPGKNVGGDIITKDMPIAVSNVALVNPKDNKPSRVGFKFVVNDNVDPKQGGRLTGRKKVRIFKSNQEVVDVD